MCLILLAMDYHPRYKLVVAANRDEFYQRPAAPACFWQDEPEILAGKDIKEGGAWMGVTRQGRFAALTNYRDPQNIKPQAPSRGHLVLDYLQNNISPFSYLDNLPEGGQEYNGFNLLAGTIDELYYYSNRKKKVCKIDRGLHAVSNSLLDVPWPKVTKGVHGLGSILNQEDIDVEDLFALMKNRDIPVDQDLPDTGVGLEMERWLAPVFIVSADYGTRSTSLLLADRNNKIRFWERSYDPQNAAISNEVYYEFQNQLFP